ncbi:SPOR domain-containing protein [Venatoribacter cucullus]|uniref:SPOR domain-containing protein n=1 Tax=Venatoribacter cucullus TaxID=2661630 RepID=UPI00223F57CE|nr:SPOR domain-containing protein [Venatoribacter cucullus]UZK04419.1 sporulation protein [Venatoribacter cucullus]
MADKGSSIPRWVWVITPTLAVAFLGFILYISTIPASNELDAVKGEARKALQQGKEKLKESAKDTPKPDYDFYKLLENQTVEVPKVDAYKSTPKDDVKYEYRLQAGSFRSLDDAERLRASLLLEGMPAYRQESSVNGSTWHRVFVGPFTDRSRVNKAHDQLVARSISPLELREVVKK